MYLIYDALRRLLRASEAQMSFPARVRNWPPKVGFLMEIQQQQQEQSQQQAKPRDWRFSGAPGGGFSGAQEGVNEDLVGVRGGNGDIVGGI